MTTMKPRLMEPGDEPHVLTMAAAALNVPRERLAIRGRVRVPVWLPRVADGFPSAMTDEDCGKLARVGIGVTTGGVWLNVEALTTVAKLATGEQRGVEIPDSGGRRAPRKIDDPTTGATLVGVSEAAPPSYVVGPQRFAEAMRDIDQKRPRTALEEQRDNDEQKALAMIRDQRREGESEPETLQRLLVDVGDWPQIRKVLRAASCPGESHIDTARRLAQGVTFQPALDASTPEIVRRCSGLPMREAAAKLAHHIIGVAKRDAQAPVETIAIPKPAAEWLYLACQKHHPHIEPGTGIVDWVMATLRKRADERDNLQALATLREGCATAWGEAVDLLGPLAEELDDDLGHEGPLDVLRRVLAERAEAEEHDLEAHAPIDVKIPPEQVIADAGAPPMALETPRDVVRFLNRRLGLDFDSCEDVAAYIERTRKVSPVGGEYRWGNDGHHRLFHDDSGALCYEGPGVKGLVNNRAHPHPGKAPVLFSDYALALIASIVNIARAAARETWLAQPLPAEQKTVRDLLASLRADGETPPSTLARVLRERATSNATIRELSAQIEAAPSAGDLAELYAALRAHGVTPRQLSIVPEAARKLRELASPFIPVGEQARNAFLASLAGKRMDEVVAQLARRALDTDAAAAALATLFPGTPVSFAGLADVASFEIRKRRAEREETEGTLGRIAALLSVERQAPVAIIEREVELVRDAARDRIEAVAEVARLRKVKRAAEVYFRAERAPSSARLDASAPRRALLDLLDSAAINWKAPDGEVREPTFVAGGGGGAGAGAACTTGGNGGGSPSTKPTT